MVSRLPAAGLVDYGDPSAKKGRPHGRDPPGGPNRNGAGVFCPAACFILRNFWALTVYSRLYPCCERRKSREPAHYFVRFAEAVIKEYPLLTYSWTIRKFGIFCPPKAGALSDNKPNL